MDLGPLRIIFSITHINLLGTFRGVPDLYSAGISGSCYSTLRALHSACRVFFEGIVLRR